MGTENSPQIRDERAGEKPPVALIAGPTASGKSDVAVRLALRLIESGRGAIIINADSAQVYRDLRSLERAALRRRNAAASRIGSSGHGTGPRRARLPTGRRRQNAKSRRRTRRAPCPSSSAGRGCICRSCSTGLPRYPRSIRQSAKPFAPCPTYAAYAALEVEDPQRAAMLAPADSQRIARALEVIRSTGSTMGQWQTRNTGGIADDISLVPLILTPERRLGLRAMRPAVRDHAGRWCHSRGRGAARPRLVTGSARHAGHRCAGNRRRAARRMDAARDDRTGDTGHPQLCETAIHMVQTPAPARLAEA